MSPKDLKPGTKYVCKDYGLIEYIRPLGDHWYLFLHLDQDTVYSFGTSDETAYDEDDVVTCVRELTSLDKHLLGVDK